ncbi:hypothetical protein [Sanguibacter sp. HDW7]|uniref:hypothetical protein n=1 Tax=Sanguibacter sp. HDW7 TaxID=2714931 RepID=UPI001408D76B|nr:hypothetical protein [Sanguibacter sp. HDW7]QIK83580.1 hypothetical protein G7063_08020 [Sanguibacter sp. HDW7]
MLIMVIGLGFTFLILALTMSISSTYAAKVSTEARAGVQAQAAADLGIDNALKQINNVVIGEESMFRCEIISSVSTESGTADVVTKVAYRLAGSSETDPYTCSGALADGTEVVAAEMIATASMDVTSTSGTKAVMRSVKQKVEITPDEPLPPLFKYGFFSNGNLHTTNNFKVDGGGVFTNGNFECNSNAQVFGDVAAIGKADLSNACYLKSLWTSGAVNCNSGATVDGALTVASSVRTYLSSGCKINGDTWTNGPLETQNTVIMGNALSAKGHILQQSDSTITGWAQAASTVTGGTVGSARVENMPSDPPAGPVNQKMPTIYWSDLVGPDAGNPAVVTYQSWLKENATRNGAASWADALNPSKPCAAAASPSWGINGNLIGPSTATVIDARACEVLFQGDGSTKPLVLTVKADTTFVVKAFTSSNALLIKGADPAKKYVVRFIVPLDEGQKSCTGAGAGRGNIVINSGGTAFDANVATFVYTNGTAELTNGVQFHGSLYACETNVSVNTHITYADGTPPGMTDDGDQKYLFAPVMRFDVRP